MQTEVNNQVAVIHNSIELFKSAPEILKQNQERTQKAIAIGNNILQQWAEAWAIEDEEQRMAALTEVDTRSNNYLVNCGNALKQEKEMRAAITQMMDLLKKMFTEAENEIDKTKGNTVPGKVQSNRDNYAAESFKVAERQRKEAELAAARAKEVIDLKAQAEIRLSNKYNDYLLTAKTYLQNGFNSISLDDFEDKQAKLKAYTPALNPDIIYSFQLGLFGNHHSRDEINAIISEIITSRLPEFTSNYNAELTMLRDELIEKLPSKKTELLEQKRLADEAAAAAEAARKAEAERQAAIAKANAEEKARLEAEAEKARQEEAIRQAELKAKQDAAIAEQKRREEEEAAKLAAEAEEAKRKAEQEAELKKQSEQTMVMFEKEAAIAESVQAPEARQGYEITILHQGAYVQIFQLWFENEGMNLPIDKIGNTKLDQMKAWCEKHAHKTGTKIESKFLKYEESFKAVNRKSK